MKCPHCGNPQSRIIVPFEATVYMQFDPEKGEFFPAEATIDIGRVREVHDYERVCCGIADARDETFGAVSDASENTFWPEQEVTIGKPGR